MTTTPAPICLSFTGLQRAVLLHRLALPHSIADALAPVLELPEEGTWGAYYNQAVEVEIALRCLPRGKDSRYTLHLDKTETLLLDVLVNCVEGSTYPSTLGHPVLEHEARRTLTSIALILEAAYSLPGGSIRIPTY